MLKLTYTTTGVTLERSDEELEVALRRRVLLGLRVGEPVTLEPTVIALEVERSLPALQGFMNLHRQIPAPLQPPLIEQASTVAIHLQGYWLSQSYCSGEGVFLLSLEPKLEASLTELWQSQIEQTACTEGKLTSSPNG